MASTPDGNSALGVRQEGVLEVWGGKRESNPQPSEPQSGALPVELFPPPQVIIATKELRKHPSISRSTGSKSGLNAESPALDPKRSSSLAPRPHTEIPKPADAPSRA